jgi:hypothetical protein
VTASHRLPSSQLTEFLHSQDVGDSLPEMSIITRPIRCHIPDDGIPSRCWINLKNFFKQVHIRVSMRSLMSLFNHVCISEFMYDVMHRRVHKGSYLSHRSKHDFCHCNTLIRSHKCRHSKTLTRNSNRKLLSCKFLLIQDEEQSQRNIQAFYKQNCVFWDVTPCGSFKNRIHGVTSQKTSFFIVTAVKTSNLTFYKHFWV